MSCYYRQSAETEIKVPKYIESSTRVIYYDIKVRVQNVEWTIERRYKDFDQLNEKLVNENSISRKLLPPKKIMGNKNPVFLEQRREQLEKYLQELLILFQILLPHVLVEFLDFNKYDIYFLLWDLAKLFKENGDSILNSKKKEYHLSALEAYAISESLCMPCINEFSTVLDFCTQLEILIITPVKDNSSFGNDYNTVDVPIGHSNIIPQNLSFNLNAFRNLKILKFFGLSTENIIDIALLKPTLETICVHNTTITHMNQVLMCGNLHKELIDVSFNQTALEVAANDTPSGWRNLTELDFTGNLLTQIDSSVRTTPNLRKLVLEQNRIRTIKNLAELPHLQVLSMSVNLIADCVDWHLELGNLVTLNLSQNKLKKLSGLRKLLSLINLDLSCNQIEDLEEVDNVACLPILETLRLTGNPLAGSVDYRPRVLARFHERAVEISLDSEKGTQKELDTALVLSALLKSKMRQKNSIQK